MALLKEADGFFAGCFIRETGDFDRIEEVVARDLANRIQKCLSGVAHPLNGADLKIGVNGFQHKKYPPFLSETDVRGHRRPGSARKSASKTQASFPDGKSRRFYGVESIILKEACRARGCSRSEYSRICQSRRYGEHNLKCYPRYRQRHPRAEYVPHT
ncbi:hypothetical protein SDC9_127980 [bioreactor metagenome]|uniref:Uncharacterized protein n=1 Tax=bioreactor metagenome TaxID=1076179 RepID=A0A645CVK3_9ZZZZ